MQTFLDLEHCLQGQQKRVCPLLWQEIREREEQNIGEQFGVAKSDTLAD